MQPDGQKNVSNVFESLPICGSMPSFDCFKFIVFVWTKNYCRFRLGNDAFRKGEYERAITMYTKAIDHVKDSPVLYNNRALTYIRYEWLLFFL